MKCPCLEFQLDSPTSQKHKKVSIVYASHLSKILIPKFFTKSKTSLIHFHILNRYLTIKTNEVLNTFTLSTLKISLVHLPCSFVIIISSFNVIPFISLIFVEYKMFQMMKTASITNSNIVLDRLIMKKSLYPDENFFLFLKISVT